MQVEEQEPRKPSARGGSNGRRCQISCPVKPQTKGSHGHHAVAPGQAIDAVDQIDGIHHDDVHEP